MAQKLLDDKITKLTQSAGTITLPAGARLTIGGQQYTNLNAINVAASLVTASARYQVFAVVSGGAVQLVVSQNENSAGPAGYNAWKLVGSYYTNGLSPIGFGSFVNIVGAPSTEWIPFLVNITSTGSSPTKGTTSVDIGNWKQSNGDTMDVAYEYQQGVAGTSGTGSYLFSMPSGKTANTNKKPVSGNFSRTTIGAASALTDGVSGSGQMRMYDASNFSAEITIESTGAHTLIGQNHVPLSGTDVRYSFEGTVPINEFSNTAIEDL